MAARIMASECLCFRARRVSRALTRLYDEALRPLGIQATQLTLMNAISLCGDGGAPMGRLADVLTMDQTTLSRNVRGLEKAGFVRIERLPTDRRMRVTVLTGLGEAMIATALPRWRHAHEEVVDALGSELASGLRHQFDAAVVATSAR